MQGTKLLQEAAGFRGADVVTLQGDKEIRRPGRLAMSALTSPVASDDRFLERFEAAWRSRDPEQVAALLHADVVLIQPILGSLHGRASAARGMAQFLQLLPDLELMIDCTMRAGDRVFIAFHFVGTLGLRRVTLACVDRIELVDGLVHSRTCFFDPTPLWLASFSQPWLWPRLLRELWRARRGARHPLLLSAPVSV